MRVGEFKARAFRVMGYMALLTAPSVLLTFVKVYGGRWYWALLAIPPIVIAWLIDPKISKGEAKYMNDNNEGFQKILDELDEIKKLLREKE